MHFLFHCNFRTRLQATLRYLKTGALYQDIAFEFIIGKSTGSGIVNGTCNTIIAEFFGELVKCPTTANEWKVTADN